MNPENNFEALPDLMRLLEKYLLIFIWQANILNNACLEKLSKRFRVEIQDVTYGASGNEDHIITKLFG